MSQKVVGICAGPGGSVVLAAGPLVKQPSTIPYRVVLLDKGSEYTVHRQGWPEMPADPSDPKGSSLQAGDYFLVGVYGRGKALELAVKKFGERLVYESEFMASVFRDGAV